MRATDVDDLGAVAPKNIEAKVVSALERQEIEAVINDPTLALDSRLTSRDEAFCKYCAIFDERGQRMSIAEAYRLSHFNGDKSVPVRTLHERAKNMFRRAAVYERVKVLKEIVDRIIMERVSSEGIAQKAVRVHRMNRDWQKLQDIVEARGRAFARIEQIIHKKEEELLDLKFIEKQNGKLSPDQTILRARLESDIEELSKEFARGAGTETGLLRVVPKTIGRGETSEVVHLVEVDKDLLRSIAELEDRVAKELGQVTSKVEVSHVKKAYVGFDPDQV